MFQSDRTDKKSDLKTRQLSDQIRRPVQTWFQTFRFWPSTLTFCFPRFCIHVSPLHWLTTLYQLLGGAREWDSAWHRKISCESILVYMSYLCLYNIFPMNNRPLYDLPGQNICIRVNDYFRLGVSPKFAQFGTIYFVANHDNSHLCGNNQCDLTWFLSVFRRYHINSD